MTIDALENNRREMEKEIALLASCTHRSILKVYSSFWEAGNLYIVLEYCEKGDLGAMLAQIELTEARVWKIFI